MPRSEPSAPHAGGKLDSAYLLGLRALLDDLQPHLSWRDFHSIPYLGSDAGGWRARVRGLTASYLGRGHPFLHPAPTRPHLLARLARRRGAGAVACFRLLCCNEDIPRAELEALLPDLARHLDSGVLQRADHMLTATLSLIPYGERFYLCEPLGRRRREGGDDDTPSYVGPQSHLQIEFLRRLCGNRRDQRFLEMGSGLGIVSLELHDLFADAQGAEYLERSVAWANASAALHGRDSIRFYQSDLFSNVAGTFDVISFNPWQPSEDCLDLIERFIETADAHLAPDGEIVLTVTSKHRAGRDEVIDALAATLERVGFSAQRFVVLSYRMSDGAGGALVESLNTLWIRRADAGHRAGLRGVQRNTGWLGFRLRGVKS